MHSLELIIDKFTKISFEQVAQLVEPGCIVTTNKYNFRNESKK